MVEVSSEEWLQMTPEERHKVRLEKINGKPLPEPENKTDEQYIKEIGRKKSFVNCAHQALALRRAGFDYKTIAEKLGLKSTNAAFMMVDDALQLTLQEAADGVRKLELDRLDELQRKVWVQALQGNLGAMDRVLRIHERRAKLMGLDAPLKVEATGKNGSALFSMGVPDMSGLSTEELRALEGILTKIQPAQRVQDALYMEVSGDAGESA